MKNILTIVLLLCTLPVHAAFYKWFDDEGATQYGGCPPAKCDSVQVELEPLVIIKYPAVKSSQTFAQKTSNKKNAKQQKSKKPKAQVITYPELGLNPALVQHECHSSPEVMSAPNWTLLAEPKIGNSLSKNQSRAVSSLFNRLTGTWRGELIETRYSKYENEFFAKKRNFELYTRVNKTQDNFLTFELELDGGRKSNPVVRQERFWFSLDDADQLRTGDGKPGNHNTRKWDGKVLNSNANSLEFATHYRRFGTEQQTPYGDYFVDINDVTNRPRTRSTQALFYRSVKSSKRQLTIIDCIYIQGIIASSREWILTR